MKDVEYILNNLNLIALTLQIPPKLTSDKQRELAAEFCFPPGTQMCYDKRLYINYLSRDEKLKHQQFTRKNMENREEVKKKYF